MTKALPPDSGPEALLKSASWLRAARTQAVFAALNDAGYEVRAVGGCVRNTLMQLPITDIDLATTATPDQITGACGQAGLEVHATGIAHGTVTVVSGDQPFEITTLRGDIETDGRHAVVAFTRDWLVDARRRDFTMNALYCDGDGTLFDPLGGLDDALARQVRFIDDPAARIREDYLRILRFFRFNAQYGACNDTGAEEEFAGFDEAGLRACITMRAGLARLSAERVRSEMLKILVGAAVVPVCRKMSESGILQMVLGVAPRPSALARLVRLEQMLQRPADPMLRLGALAIAVSDDSGRLVRRLKLSNEEARTLGIVGDTGSPANPIASPPADDEARRLLYRWGAEAFTARVLASWAARGPLEQTHQDFARWQALYELPAHWQVPQLPLSGADIVALGIAPGPAVGEILRAFEDWWTSAGFPLDKAECSTRINKIVANYQQVSAATGHGGNN